LKLIDGNTRKLGRRAFAEQISAEPVARRGFPDPPQHLKGHALECWMKLTEELTAMGMDALIDAMAVQAAATMFGRATDADIALEAETERTDDTRNLQICSNQSWALYRQYASDLGANVVSRSRLSVAGPKKSVSAIDDAIFGT
jgi:phage terminase small subunit